MKNVVKNNNPLLQPWLMWGLAVAFYFYEFLLQVSPNVMVPELMRAFQLNAAQLGNLTACYFYAYAAMQIPSGILLDRYGPRFLLTAATSFCVLGCLLLGTATTLVLAQIGRFSIGFGAAFAVLGCFRLIANWFPTQRFAFLTSLTVTVGMLGAIGGQAPLALLVEFLDWRASLIFLALIGGLLAFQIWRKVRNAPGDESFITTTLDQAPFFHGIQNVLRNKANWVTAFYGGLMFAPTSILGALWGVPFLMSAYGISRPSAAGIISTLFIGWAVGAPLTGFFADHLNKRDLTLLIGTLGALLTLSLFIYIHMPLFLLGCTLFAFGFFSSGFLPSFAIVQEINPAENSATALGFMNMINMLGGALGQPFIGYLLDLMWHGQLNNGSRVYSAITFQTALSTLPLCILAALFLLLLIRKMKLNLPQTTQH